MTRKHIVLVGPMGVGKTTIGRELASELGRTFHDSDADLAREYGVDAATVADRDGVDTLHGMELEIFLDMVGPGAPGVIAPAASVVDTEEGRDMLRRHHTIWLDAAESVLKERRVSGSHRRSIDADERIELETRRAQWWEDLSVMRVDTSRPVSDVVDEIAESVTTKTDESAPGD